MGEDNRPRFLREHRPLPAPRVLAGPVVPPGEAEAYAQAAYKAEVQAVAVAVVGTKNDTLNVSAFNLGQLVASGHLSYEAVWSGLYDAALLSGLTEKESTGTLNSGLRAGMDHARDVPERPEDPSVGAGDRPLVDGDQDEPLADVIDFPTRLDWHDLWEADDEEEEWIVAPIIPARRLVALYSQAKMGKSLLMLELAVGIARGITVLDYTPERPRRVLYVDLENDPRGDIRTRLQRMQQKPADLDNLVYLSFPQLPMLDTALGAARLLEVVEHFSCEVVVIDTISRLVAGEENDNNTWLSFYRHTGKLMKSHGLAMVRLDHSGKDPTRGMRGGSAKYSDVDLVWSLTRPSDDMIQLECTAQRLPVRERLVTLRRNHTPWLHHTVIGQDRAVAWKAEQDDTIAFLDALLGEDAPITVRQALKVLRANGRGKRQQDVAALLRTRSQALSDRGLTFDPDPDQEPS